jgi:hypothetical protein
MPRHPEYANRVWKWDFQPDQSAHSSTRPCWRIYGLVENPKDKQVLATAFLAYPKSETPRGDHTKMLVEALRLFLRANSFQEQEEERFRRQVDGIKTVSLCLLCCEMVIVTSDPEVLAAAEAAHACLN